MKHRVAIVGGGITGLPAAVWRERDHGIDDAVVVEAAGTAGGKIRSKTDAGSTPDPDEVAPRHTMTLHGIHPSVRRAPRTPVSRGCPAIVANPFGIGDGP